MFNRKNIFLTIVKNDCCRKKVITFAVFVFITMAVIMGASAANIIANLIQSMSDLQSCAVPADLAQMHSGEYSQEAIDEFVGEQSENIAMQETMQLMNIEGNHIYYGEGQTLAGTIQDNSFVVPNSKFDFLLDLNNEKLEVKQGEIAVPVYFMQECDLEIGDTISVITEDYQKSFVISDYARDYEMSNSLTSSKRFAVHPEDYKEMLAHQAGEQEYLIEFKLTEEGNAQAVQTDYIEAGLPANGPTIGKTTFTLLNAMSDAVVSVVIVLIGILLLIIVAFCIRLTFLATMDEDMKEIGIMKAMGISRCDIRKVYLSKYRAMAVVASAVGYFLSFFAVNLFNGNMRLYLSSDLTGNLKYLLALAAPIAVYAMIVAYCKKVLKRIDRISSVEALRADIMENRKKQRYRFPLMKNRMGNIHIYMGIRDVWKRFRLYRLLIAIFIVCSFIVILPLNLYNTINSPEFTTYMGIGKCDMRIDLRRTETITEDFEKLKEDLKQDADIKKQAAYITCYYQMENSEGGLDYIMIETGDFSVFPLKYLEGRAPEGESEIALSYANASKDGLNKKIGDEVRINASGEEKIMKVCGIYQDITNGGKTAKAGKGFEINEKAVLWYIVYLDLADGVSIDEKMEEYHGAYPLAQVNDAKLYALQTLGNINQQVKVVVAGGFAVAILIVVLITALFIKMLLAKDMAQNAIMRSMGLTSKNLRHQYMSGILLVLLIGTILGVIASNLLGEMLLSMGLSTMGAAKIEFVNVLWQTCLVCPMVLILAVCITISVCCRLSEEKDLSVILRS